jgi:hypothetical protein
MLSFRTRSLVACLVVLSAGVSHAADSRKSIPERFQGEWSSNLASCTDLGADDLAIRVSPSVVYFYESKGRVVAVAAHGELELAIILDMSGEGEVWMQTIQFRLSKDRKTLTDVNARKPGTVRVRCPRKSRK